MKTRSSEMTPGDTPRPRHVRARLGGAVIVAAALISVGCGSSSSNDSSNGANTANLVTSSGPAAGDISHLNWALPIGEPDTIDPRNSAYYSSALVADNLCDTLARQLPNGTFVPNLASWKLVNPTTLVYTLRSDVKFWDGSSMTSADVVYSLQRASAPDAIVSFLFGNVKSITANGPTQVTLKFKQPDELFINEMSTFAGAVVEKKYAEKVGKEFGSPKGGVMCSGPLKLDKWTPGQNITLSRFDGYWNPDFRAHAATVTLNFVPDSTALAQGLISGELDGAWEVPPAIIPRLQDSDSGRLFLGPSRQYYSVSNLGPDTWFTKDPTLMTALLKSIDREAVAEKVFHGAGSPNYTLLAKNTWDAGAEDLWAEAYKPFEAERKYDLEGAKKLVEASSYDGSPLVLMTAAGDATQSQIAQLIQEQGKQIGLNIQMKPRSRLSTPKLASTRVRGRAYRSASRPHSTPSETRLSRSASLSARTPSTTTSGTATRLRRNCSTRRSKPTTLTSESI